jgi:hypothetical protein
MAELSLAARGGLAASLGAFGIRRLVASST